MTVLKEQLISDLRAHGPSTFRDLMERALYDPEHGYYNTAALKIGPAGDYYTSSNVHPAFGATLADALARFWRADPVGESTLAHGHSPGAPRLHPLSLVEFGAGSGQLAFDVLAALRAEHGEAFDGISYHIVERSPAMRELQHEKLAEFRDVVQWTEDVAEPFSALPKPFHGIVLSNEFVDALAVHALRLSDGALHELYVAAIEADSPDRAESDSPSTLAFRWDRPSTPRIAQYVERISATFQPPPSVATSTDDSFQFEVNLDAIDWLQKTAEWMDSGYVVTIDYGDLAPLLWSADRRNGTLRGFRNHVLTQSLLDEIGEQDITASVNFTALIEYGTEFGLELVSYEPQSAFLINNGFLDRIASPASENADSIQGLKDQLLWKSLIAPGGASHNFRVLIQRKRSRV